MEKISCFLTLNHTHLSQPYIKSIDFLRDEGENKQNMLIFVSGCSTPLNINAIILVSWTISCKMHIIFQKDVDNFEIEHKTGYFWSGVQFPLNDTTKVHFLCLSFVSFSIEVLCHNPRLPGLPDHALPVLNHDQTDHNTKPMEHWCIATVAWSSYYCMK